MISRKGIRCDEYVPSILLARRAEGVPGLELGGVTHGGRSQWAGPGDDAQHIVVGRGGIA